MKLTMILNELFEQKIHAIRTFATGWITSISIYVGELFGFSLAFDMDYLTWIPATAGTLIPVVIAAYYSVKKNKQKLAHKEENHNLEILAKLKELKMLKEDMTTEEIKELIRQYGGDL